MLNTFLNATPASWAECVFRLLQTMCASGWQVISYSNGSAKSLSAVTNAFPYSSANTGLTASADLNNNRAWFVVQQPPLLTPVQAGGGIPLPWAGTRQICVQRGNGTTQWRIKYSFSGAFTSPDVTGSVLTTPTGNTSSFFNDSVFNAGGGTDIAPTFGTLFAGSEGSSRLQIIVDNGSITGSFSGSIDHTGTLPNPWPYAFLMATFNAGGQAQASSVWMMDPMKSGSFVSSELDPYVFYYQGSSAGCFMLVNGDFTSPNGAASPGTWFRKGVATNQFNAVAGCILRTRQFASGDVAAWPSNAGSNAHTNQDDFMPIPYMRVVGITQSPGLGGYKGISSLVRICPRSFNTGVVFSMDKSRDRMALGSVIMPWDGSAVLI